jgi:hypothetical protein
MDAQLKIMNKISVYSTFRVSVEDDAAKSTTDTLTGTTLIKKYQ